jgi:hypothetical protein
MKSLLYSFLLSIFVVSSGYASEPFKIVRGELDSDYNFILDGKYLLYLAGADNYTLYITEPSEEKSHHPIKLGKDAFRFGLAPDNDTFLFLKPNSESEEVFGKDDILVGSISKLFAKPKKRPKEITTKLSPEVGANYKAEFTPDSKGIVYTSLSEKEPTKENLWLIETDGSNKLLLSSSLASGDRIKRFSVLRNSEAEGTQKTPFSVIYLRQKNAKSIFNLYICKVGVEDDKYKVIENRMLSPKIKLNDWNMHAIAFKANLDGSKIAYSFPGEDKEALQVRVVDVSSGEEFVLSQGMANNTSKSTNGSARLDKTIQFSDSVYNRLVFVGPTEFYGEHHVNSPIYSVDLSSPESRETIIEIGKGFTYYAAHSDLQIVGNFVVYKQDIIDDMLGKRWVSAAIDQSNSVKPLPEDAKRAESKDEFETFIRGDDSYVMIFHEKTYEEPTYSRKPVFSIYSLGETSNTLLKQISFPEKKFPLSIRDNFKIDPNNDMLVFRAKGSLWGFDISPLE